MNKIFTVILLFSSVIANAQTATDWTANDCDGNSHHLFDELNSGNVLVLDFVMPCLSCVNPSLTAYNIVQSYSTSNPGTVKFYLIDDYADTNCQALLGWADNNGLGSVLTGFSSSLIDIDAYGGPAMPRIVIVGGPNHTIYFNRANNTAGNATDIQSAINLALTETAVNDPINTSIKVFPNPASEQLTIDNEQLTIDEIQIVDLVGMVVITNHQPLTTSHTINIDNLSSGIYILKIISGENVIEKKFFVQH